MSGRNPVEVRTRKRRKLFDYKGNQAWTDNMSVIMQLGLTMAGCIGFCFAVGYYIDRWLGTRGIFVTLFILFGVIGGGNVVYRQINEIIGDTKLIRQDLRMIMLPFGKL